MPSPRLAAEKVVRAITESTMMNSSISIRVPDIAENGDLVPITVDATDSPSFYKRLYLYIPKNPNPYVATVDIGLFAQPIFSTRVKLFQSGQSTIYAVFETASGDLHYTKALTEVNIPATDSGDELPVIANIEPKVKVRAKKDTGEIKLLLDNKSSYTGYLETLKVTIDNVLMPMPIGTVHGTSNLSSTSYFQFETYSDFINGLFGSDTNKVHISGEGTDGSVVNITHDFDE